MNTPNKPIIAHGMRTFLGRTETFIGNQVCMLQKFASVVFCYEKKEFPGFTDQVDSISVLDQFPSFIRAADHILYGKFRTTNPFSMKRISSAIAVYNPQLIHYHFLVDARFLLEVKKRLGIPALASAYGYDVSSFPHRLGGYGLLYLRKIYREIDYFTAMSNDMKKDMIKIGVPADKIIIHHYGIKTNRFQFPERVYEDKAVVNILCCGSLEIKKSQHLILEALRYAQRNKFLKRDFTVDFVGDGPMRPYIERQIQEYGWQNKVTLAGYVPHNDKTFIDHYRQADIFCMPSMVADNGAKEGIPTTIMEGMASGLPIISTYHAGIPEIVESGVEGILVPEGNIEKLAQALSEVINDFKLRERMGKNAAKKAITKLDIIPHTQELESIYQAIINGTARTFIE